MSDSDTSSLSSLSSAPPTDDEAVAAEAQRSIGIERYFKRAPANAEPKAKTPPPPKRAPSPPHEYVLADNPDIAFLVMFRARFSDVFPKSLPHFGPQDIERDVQETVPGEHVERLLCALVGLVLNRKKDVERGHYTRALEEVVHMHQSQWPRAWQDKNPLHGGGSFTSMSPTERLTFLRALVLWSLSSSEAVQAKLKESYRQNRHDDDLNQPLSVQPWGTDAYKRRYWLIEGRDDTHFRLYREGNPGSPTKNTWWSVAGNIDELKAVAHTLTEDRSANSRRLSERILAAIPRFEGSEEKRKRRDYRLARKAAFARPEPGFSLYEGRTRGKKIKYTYSDDEDWSFDSGADQGTRRSNRNRHSSPVDQGPVYTASGRQVRSRQGGLYGETMTVGKRRADRSSPLGRSGDEAGQGLAAEAGGRPGTRRAAAAAAAAIGAPRVNGKRHYEWEFDDGNESNGAVKEEEEWQNDEEYEGSGESDDGEDEAQRSVIVRLRYRSSGSGEEMKVKSEGTTAQDAPQLNPPNPSTNGTSFPPNSEVNTPAPPTTTATSSEAIPSPNPPSGIENINAAPSQPSIKPSPPQPVSEPLQKVGNIAYGQKQPFEVQIPLQPELGRQSMHHQFRPEAAGEYVEECAPPRS